MRRKSGLGTLTLVVLSAFGGMALAAPGDLDPSYGEGGFTYVEGAGSHPNFSDLGATPDGGVVAGGDAYKNKSGTKLNVFLTRLDENGDLDPTFSDDGYLQTDLPANDNTQESAESVDVNADGEIAVGAFTGQIEMAAMMFEADGDLKSAFSDDGFAHYRGGDGTEVEWTPDGGLAIGGGGANFFAEQFVIYKLQGDGSLDPAFSEDGKAKVPLGSFTPGINDLELMEDGSIIAAGLLPEAKKGVGVIKLTPAGELDESFSGDGVARYDLGDNQVEPVIESTDSGNAFVGSIQRANGAYAEVGAIDPAGALDPGFSEDGVARVKFADADASAGFLRAALDLRIAGEGDLVGGGTAYSVSNEKPRFVAFRLDDDGSFDSAFSGNGRSSIALPSDGYAQAVEAAQGGNRVLIGGGARRDGVVAALRAGPALP